MSRLIDADKTLKGECESCLCGEGSVNCLVCEIKGVLNDAPTVDAEPIRHGEWVLHGNDDDMGSTYFCSQCNFQLDSDLFYSGYEGGKWVENNVFKYCPNCGAKMDGERKE